MSYRQEGYCDGLAGIGLQDRLAIAKIKYGQEVVEAMEYIEGFHLGSHERKVMLEQNNS